MKNFDTRAYSIADFVEWDNNGLLEISSDFQRRSVWSEKAKSYLIDTVLRGKPIPKIIMVQTLKGSRTQRIIVDGQQRLRAILGYINGDFKISRAHNTDLAGITFEKLPKSLRDDFLQYELGVDLLFDTPYEDILDIFARMNSYTVSLNGQEKLNAKYLGYFKQAAYRNGYRYVQYFLDSTVLTRASVARMGEAEIVGDILSAFSGGVQTNKSVETYYKRYEDDIRDLETVEDRFNTTFSYLGRVYPPDELGATNWSRIHLFYTLFTSLAHCLFGLKNLDSKLRVKLGVRQAGRVRVVLDEISVTFDEIAADLDNDEHPEDYKRFIYYSRRGTTDTAARKYRSEFVCGKLKEAL